VVTGASGGIGGAVARRFARDGGATVVNLDARPGGDDLATVRADLADEAAVTAAFAEIDRLFAGEPPDVLVCCAAVSVAGHFLDVPVATSTASWPSTSAAPSSPASRRPVGCGAPAAVGATSSSSPR
jgi:NAD(P)-dependent dehydrogenase (short-subunit alcohol dehydrogenase family)